MNHKTSLPQLFLVLRVSLLLNHKYGGVVFTNANRMAGDLRDIATNNRCNIDFFNRSDYVQIENAMLNLLKRKTRPRKEVSFRISIMGKLLDLKVNINCRKGGGYLFVTRTTAKGPQVLSGNSLAHSGAVRTPDDAVRVCADLKDLALETFQVLTLNARHRLLNRHLVSLGLVDSSLAHPREVFRPAILDGASAVIAVHNHPSGDPTPSTEDVRITRQLVEAGKIIGIHLMDHVIIGRSADGTVSRVGMRESGLCGFPA